MDRGAWWATVHRVTELDMSCSRSFYFHDHHFSTNSESNPHYFLVCLFRRIPWRLISGWVGFSTGAARAVLRDFVSWWSFWIVKSVLVCCTWQSETANLEPAVQRTIFGLPTVTHAVSSIFRQKNLLKYIFTVQNQKVQLRKKKSTPNPSLLDNHCQHFDIYPFRLFLCIYVRFIYQKRKGIIECNVLL